MLPLFNTDPWKWHAEVKCLTEKKIANDIKMHQDNGLLVTSTEMNVFFSTICAIGYWNTHPRLLQRIDCRSNRIFDFQGDQEGEKELCFVSWRTASKATDWISSFLAKFLWLSIVLRSKYFLRHRRRQMYELYPKSKVQNLVTSCGRSRLLLT